MTSHADFYFATATIIPVLFLVFSVQNREFWSKEIYENQAESDILLGLGVIVGGLTCAEALALAGLLGFHSSFSVAVIILGIGSSTQWIATSALRGRPKKILEDLRSNKAVWVRERIGTYFDIWVARIAISVPGIISVIGAAIVLAKDIK
jgi:hypothetical protein